MNTYIPTGTSAVHRAAAPDHKAGEHGTEHHRHDQQRVPRAVEELHTGHQHAAPYHDVSRPPARFGAVGAAAAAARVGAGAVALRARARPARIPAAEVVR